MPESLGLGHSCTFQDPMLTSSQVTLQNFDLLSDKASVPLQGGMWAIKLELVLTLRSGETEVFLTLDSSSALSGINYPEIGVGEEDLDRDEALRADLIVRLGTLEEIIDALSEAMGGIQMPEHKEAA